MNRSILVLLGAVIGLSSCELDSASLGPKAGGEDFPNTLQALGRSLAMGADSSKEWNSLDSASGAVGADLSLSDSSAIFARRLASSCQDTTYGRLTNLQPITYLKVDRKCGIIGELMDSMQLVLLDNAKGGQDTAFDFFVVDSQLLRYRVLTTIVDADGDGRFLLRNDPGRIQFSEMKSAGNWKAYAKMVMDPGPDGLYDPGTDNRIYSGSRTLVYKTDTVSHEIFTPYVAGMPVISTTIDSSRVWVDKIKKGAVRTRTERGLFMAFRDTTRNYPTFFRAHTAWVGGGFRDEMVYGTRTDSQFVAGDTVSFLDRAKSGDDSLRVEVKAILSKDLGKRTGDSLLSIRAERYRSKLSERHSVWQFLSDKPVANGQDAQAGDLKARVDFSNGQWISFDGRWVEGTFSGTYMTQSDTAYIVVDRRGNVVSVTKK